MSGAALGGVVVPLGHSPIQPWFLSPVSGEGQGSREARLRAGFPFSALYSPPQSIFSPRSFPWAISSSAMRIFFGWVVS